MPEANDLFEIIHSTRAMRRLKADPVPEELIQQILEAAVAAPNAANRQAWRFLVIKDRAIKEQVQRYYKRAMDESMGQPSRASEPPPGLTREQYDRHSAAAAYLGEHLHDVPVWIVACLDEGSQTPTRRSGASIYPAVQNILLAARALGLGATLTTLHLQYEKETEAILGLPPGAHSYALIPIGYPMGRFGPVRRVPLAKVVYQDRWGQPYSGLG